MGEIPSVHARPDTDAARGRSDSSSSSRSVGAPSAHTHDASVAIENAQSMTSIYEVRSRATRYLILAAVGFASLLVPLTDTVYLPALQIVGRDLHADETQVAASVSVFMFTVGIGNLFWGPFSDRFGRRLTFALSSIAFLGTTLGCAFSPNISVLVAMRALQGFAECAYLTAGQAVVVDIFEPAVRGSALGVFLLSLLVGPIIGPLMGGALSQSLGWRATFILLAIFCGAIGPVLTFIMPETHQHLVLTRLRKSDHQLAASVIESQQILAARPTFLPPWSVLKYLIEPEIAPYALVNMWAFGILFASLTQWPLFMGQPPYSLSQTMIGVSYICIGVAAFSGSLLGGVASDKTASASPGVPEGRLPINLAFALVLMPAGSVIIGWCLSYRTMIVGPLAGHFLIGLANAGFQPGLYSYVCTLKQANAAGASAVLNASMFAMGGVLILVSVPGVNSMGVGPFFTLLAAIQVLLALVAGACIWRSFKVARVAGHIAQ